MGNPFEEASANQERIPLNEIHKQIVASVHEVARTVHFFETTNKREFLCDTSTFLHVVHTLGLKAADFQELHDMTLRYLEIAKDQGVTKYKELVMVVLARDFYGEDGGVMLDESRTAETEKVLDVLAEFAELDSLQVKLASLSEKYNDAFYDINEDGISWLLRQVATTAFSEERVQSVIGLLENIEKVDSSEGIYLLNLWKAVAVLASSDKDRNDIDRIDETRRKFFEVFREIDYGEDKKLGAALVTKFFQELDLFYSRYLRPISIIVLGTDGHTLDDLEYHSGETELVLNFFEPEDLPLPVSFDKLHAKIQDLFENFSKLPCRLQREVLESLSGLLEKSFPGLVEGLRVLREESDDNKFLDTEEIMTGIKENEQIERERAESFFTEDYAFDWAQGEYIFYRPRKVTFTSN